MDRVGPQLRRALTICAGLIIASGVASAAFALLTGDIKIFTLTFFVVTVVATILGLPAYMAVRAAQKDTPTIAALIGFIVGAAIPAFLIFVGPAADQASVGGMATVIDGSYTGAGWLQNFQMLGSFGLLGVIGALVFWAIVRRGAVNEVDEDPRPRSSRIILLAAGAVGVIATAFVVPYVTADRSCHNPLRDGRESIAPVASFDLRVGVDQWRNVEKEMEVFQQSGGWSVRSDVRTDEEFPWLQISLCKEPGTNIFVQGVRDQNLVIFGVSQPQGGSSWRKDFRALANRIVARWPTMVVLKDGQGQPSSNPEWIAIKRGE